MVSRADTGKSRVGVTGGLQPPSAGAIQESLEREVTELTNQSSELIQELQENYDKLWVELLLGCGSIAFRNEIQSYIPESTQVLTRNLCTVSGQLPRRTTPHLTGFGPDEWFYSVVVVLVGSFPGGE